MRAMSSASAALAALARMRYRSTTRDRSLEREEPAKPLEVIAIVEALPQHQIGKLGAPPMLGKTVRRLRQLRGHEQAIIGQCEREILNPRRFHVQFPEAVVEGPRAPALDLARVPLGRSNARREGDQVVERAAGGSRFDLMPELS